MPTLMPTIPIAADAKLLQELVNTKLLPALDGEERQTGILACLTLAAHLMDGDAKEDALRSAVLESSTFMSKHLAHAASGDASSVAMPPDAANLASLDLGEVN